MRRNTQLLISLTFVLCVFTHVAFAYSLDETKGRIGNAMVGFTRNAAVKVGLNFGATTPTKIPYGVNAQAYAPNFAPVLSFYRSFHFTQAFALQIGLQFEYKGMLVRARVHDYYTEVNKEQDGVIVRFRGSFTGEITTQVSNSYATLPLLFSLRITPGYALKFGGYASYVLSHSFAGTVENGYVWTRPSDNTSVSNKVFIEREEFSFNKEMKQWDAGLLLFGEHALLNNFYLEAGLSLGLTSVFRRNFTGISYPMQNIYLSLGIGYTFPPKASHRE